MKWASCQDEFPPQRLCTTPLSALSAVGVVSVSLITVELSTSALWVHNTMMKQQSALHEPCSCVTVCLAVPCKKVTQRRAHGSSVFLKSPEEGLYCGSVVERGVLTGVLEVDVV
ncbi:hypothetical protein DNTS_002654 [Danionella cerebrum]|uniref:Uncharacterized protein n=1 Tax=Danionella cerebrum TaxID=2873325 RepID=A0A553QKL1_9TELE|nr:hypothetical protein DNTS_002654 [Danionella translucida]